MKASTVVVIGTSAGWLGRLTRLIAQLRRTLPRRFSSFNTCPRMLPVMRSKMR